MIDAEKVRGLRFRRETLRQASALGLASPWLCILLSLPGGTGGLAVVRGNLGYLDLGL